MAIKLDTESTTTAELAMSLHGSIHTLDQLTELAGDETVANLALNCRLDINQLYARIAGDGDLDFSPDYRPRKPDHLHLVP